MSIEELSGALGISTKTLRRWAADGCPHQGGGDQPYQFDLAAVVAWSQQNGRTGERGRPALGVSPEDIRNGTAGLNLRLKRLDADLKRLDAQRKERIERTAMGQLVPVDEVERGRIQRIAIVKTGLLSLPGKLAARLANREAPEIQAEIEREVIGLLAQFAGEKPPEIQPEAPTE